MIWEPKLERFIICFNTQMCHRQNTCNCGKEFYNSDGWQFEGSERERLEKSGAINLPHSVTTLEFEGSQYVQDCDCWHKRARKIMSFIDSHNKQIADYINLEREDAIKVANDMPTVKKE